MSCLKPHLKPSDPSAALALWIRRPTRNQSEPTFSRCRTRRNLRSPRKFTSKNQKREGLFGKSIGWEIKKESFKIVSLRYQLHQITNKSHKLASTAISLSKHAMLLKHIKAKSSLQSKDLGNPWIARAHPSEVHLLGSCRMVKPSMAHWHHQEGPEGPGDKRSYNFEPAISKVWAKMEIFPQIGVNIEDLWNHPVILDNCRTSLGLWRSHIYHDTFQAQFRRTVFRKYEQNGKCSVLWTWFPKPCQRGESWHSLALCGRSAYNHLAPQHTFKDKKHLASQ